MGILTPNSIVGRISGKVAGVVFAKWKQKQVIRTAPEKRKKRAAERDSLPQLKQRSLFKLVAVFLSSIGADIINVGYQQGRKSKVSSLNAALSYHLLHSIGGEYPDFVIDYGKVKLSRPIQTTEQAWNPAFTSGVNRLLRVTWQLNPFPQKTTRKDDIAVIVFFNETRMKNIRQDIYHNSIKRSDLTFSLTAASIHIGDEICCWMYFVSADNQCVSETAYLGKVRILD